MSTTPRIISATIKTANYQEVVTVTLDDNTELELFSYYADELSFWDQEFIGLTVEQGRDLFTKKDIAYLQS
jgi:hypothetical protein